MTHDQSFTNQKFKLVGSRVNRPDGVDKVTGRAKYGLDINFVKFFGNLADNFAKISVKLAKI